MISSCQVPPFRPHTTPYPPPSTSLILRLYRPRCGESNRALLPSSSSLTSFAAVRPSSLRFFSMALLRSRAALSSALRVHPMVREHSLITLPVQGSQGEKAIYKKKRRRWISVKLASGNKAGFKSCVRFISSLCDPSVSFFSSLGSSLSLSLSLKPETRRR